MQRKITHAVAAAFLCGFSCCSLGIFFPIHVQADSLPIRLQPDTPVILVEDEEGDDCADPDGGGCGEEEEVKAEPGGGTISKPTVGVPGPTITMPTVRAPDPTIITPDVRVPAPTITTPTVRAPEPTVTGPTVRVPGQ